MRFLRGVIVTAALVAAGTVSGAAQSAPSGAPPPLAGADSAQGANLVVSLVTMGPGPNIWDRFGHTAIWIADSVSGRSEAYNYGLFDFNQEGFLLRFLRGRMWYWMAPFPAEQYIGSYIRADRSVWVQELNLTPAERAALRDFLEWNAREENRFYAYDYYRDNCSTRVRDALDRVLGGAIRHATDTLRTGTTYRSQTRRLLAPAPPAYAGTQFALGSPTDVPLSAWQAMFVPMEMQRAIRGITVPAPTGGVRPLVRAEYTLHESGTYDERMTPPAWWPVFLGIGVVVGGVFAGLGGGGRRARRWFGALAAGWCGVLGLVGLVMTSLWALTAHDATYRNENLLQANLLLLPLALLASRAAAGAPWSARPARLLAAAVAALSVLGFVVQLLPGFDQANAEVIAVMLPANLGLWLGVRGVARGAAAGQSVRTSPSAAASTSSPGATSLA